VPTRETLDRLIGLMSIARINHFELYTEHTFAYPGHEEVWRDASPITPDDVAWLDSRCREAGIELVPNQNCFAHMARWLKHRTYAGRAETPGGFTLAPGFTLPPSTLAPTPDNAAFALSLLDDLLPNFGARRVNIGCDETFELGKGASADEVLARGKVQVYLNHVRRIIDPLLGRGYEVLMWADILRQDPRAAQELPSGVVPIAWCYEAPSPDGRTRASPPEVTAFLAELGVDLDTFAGFERNVAPLVEADIPFWVAPGTSAWCSLIGRIDNAEANLLDAAEVGHAQGAKGFLITDWGDDGHLPPPSISFGPLLYGGAVSWGVEANRHIDIGDVLDRYAFLDQEGVLGASVVDLGLLWAETGQTQVNGSPLHASLVPDGVSFVSGEPDIARLVSVLERLDTDLRQIESSTPRCDDATQVKLELLVAGRLARHGAQRLLKRAGAETFVDWRTDLEQLIAEQRAAWLGRSRPGGLPDSIARLERTLATYG
ncbi:MAG TPA: hypothetical protein VK217_00020, partial [Acidimicrobiales bacterium]|nr:hypothetical protein [Acidimicrobiales bacterium]